MIKWLRRVTPALFLAAVVALLITPALAKLDRVENDRIVGSVRWAAHEGLTVDERLGVYERSIRRSIFVHQPVLVASAAVCIGFFCRNRRWAWLTAILAIIPALLMGAGFLLDTPLIGSVLMATYVALAIVLTSASVSIRNRVVPVVAAPSP
ncbi:MAG: hypothetical protein QNL88_14425 [Acidobacteriota bacterium]|nr:hypothetical protein [Acidobacteriota bacterium]